MNERRFTKVLSAVRVTGGLVTHAGKAARPASTAREACRDVRRDADKIGGRPGEVKHFLRPARTDGEGSPALMRHDAAADWP
jgi:hypothetical protein